MLRLKNHWYGTIAMSLLIILTILFIYFYLKYDYNKKQKALSLASVYTKGIIIEARHRRGLSVKYQFKVNLINYESWRVHVEKDYSVGDTVKIRYYKYNPKINEMLE